MPEQAQTEKEIDNRVEQAAWELAYGTGPAPGWSERFSEAQRIRIVKRSNEIHRRRVERLHAEKKAARRSIRARTRGHERRPCVACQASKLITVQHHVHPVAKADPYDPKCTHYVWLCPNCHATLHLFARQRTYDCLGSLYDEGLMDGERWSVIIGLVADMSEKD